MSDDASTRTRRPTRSQVLLGLTIIAFAILAFVVQDIPINSAALYIGLPTLLSLGLALLPKSKTVTGTILKGTTIALLMAAIFLEAGVVCLIFASPLFYAVGVLIGKAIDSEPVDRDRQPHRAHAIVCMLAVLSMEGVTELTSFDRFETVEVTRVFHANALEIEAQLARAPQFRTERPLFVRLGFPWPASASGTGLDVGDRRSVYMNDGTAYLQPWKSIDGEVVFEISERGPNQVRFKLVSDDSHVARWLEWTHSEVRWQSLGDSRTEVTWSLGFRRLLDPWWYFAPWQRLGAKVAAEVLIENLATPR